LEPEGSRDGRDKKPKSRVCEVRGTFFFLKGGGGGGGDFVADAAFRVDRALGIVRRTVSGTYSVMEFANPQGASHPHAHARLRQKKRGRPAWIRCHRAGDATHIPIHFRASAIASTDMTSGLQQRLRSTKRVQRELLRPIGVPVFRREGCRRAVSSTTLDAVNCRTPGGRRLVMSGWSGPGLAAEWLSSPTRLRVSAAMRRVPFELNRPPIDDLSSPASPSEFCRRRSAG